ncbi:2'-5' RNA ligase family protein [Kovacikia minuta CCNUW1]|uniref:2'-5' RNA ligase family protein n=1 Tax=Kovacikia minuta TaxID=2931930 RepID=UPI001CCC3D0F|nr:2'-5' RNA ligase family protein [Kovacikia minuta]UBF24055.1 2'-5' RNA ligase family protein [Kovacikia minuta CCNUW1]
MNSSKHRFFIALLPPQEVQEYARGVQQVFVDRYNSQAALKSPPHITLQPPFEWLEQDLSSLNHTLSEFALQHPSVPITLSGFAAFAPRVIYINVQKTPELLGLQADLMTAMESTLGIIDPVSKTRPFAPHLTVGFRDLTRQNFRAAWAEFQDCPVQFKFTVANLTLLIHNGQRWTICHEFPFFSIP